MGVVVQVGWYRGKVEAWLERLPVDLGKEHRFSLAEEMDTDRHGAYGEFPLRSMAQLLLHPSVLDLTGGEVGRGATFLDFGSGTGRLVLDAAAAWRVPCVGLELVPSRHAAAQSRRAEACGTADSAALAEFFCADALADAPAEGGEQLARATRAFSCNAVWADALNALLVARVGSRCPKLRSLALLKEPPADALAAAGLELVRKSAVGVTWDRVGWPLYVYRKRRPGDGAARVVVDACHEAAVESRDGFSMC